MYPAAAVSGGYQRTHQQARTTDSYWIEAAAGVTLDVRLERRSTLAASRIDGENLWLRLSLAIRAGAHRGD